MQPDQIRRSQVSYRRGLILGLTMAEIVLLLLFSLLLGVGVVMHRQQQILAEALQERDALRSQLAASKQRLDRLIAELGRDDLEKLVKELVTLRENEEKILYLIERFKLAGNAEEQVKALVEKLSRLDQLRKEIEKLGLPIDPEKLAERFEKLANANTEISRLEKIVSELQNQIKEAKHAASQKEGQIASLKRTLDRYGRGTEKPACWADEQTGRPKYIYNVGLTSSGLIMRLSAIPPWAEAKKLPATAIPFDVELEPRAFLRAADPIFQWSEQNDCRFFVRAYDLTGATEKAIYKRQMRYLESAFYKYEVLDEQWR